MAEPSPAYDEPDRDRPAPLPRHVTTPLLTLVTEQALEEEYRHVAERRGQAPRPPGPTRSRWAGLVAVACFGLLVSVAAVQNSRNAEVDESSRGALIARIEEQRSNLQARRDQLVELTRENEELTAEVQRRRASRQVAAGRVRGLGAVSGFGPVSGEGVRISVEGNPEGDENQQVRDSDLALLVDGLWEAGAEAIAVNDQRLNALGSIRNTGVAINVNTRPLTAPYVVRAVGDTRTLQARLLETTHGTDFFALAAQLGFVYTMQNVDQMVLPAAGLRPLRQVRVVSPGQGNPGLEEGSR